MYLKLSTNLQNILNHNFCLVTKYCTVEYKNLRIIKRYASLNFSNTITK